MRYRLAIMGCGRDLMSWSGDPGPLFPDDLAIVTQVRRMGALLSRDIDLVWYDGSPEKGEWNGGIFAGMNKVGQFRVTAHMEEAE